MRALQSQCAPSSPSGFTVAMGLRAGLEWRATSRPGLQTGNQGTGFPLHCPCIRLRPSQPWKLGCCFKDVSYFRSVEIKRKPWRGCNNEDNIKPWAPAAMGFLGLSGGWRRDGFLTRSYCDTLPYSCPICECLRHRNRPFWITATFCDLHNYRRGGGREKGMWESV